MATASEEFADLGRNADKAPTDPRSCDRTLRRNDEHRTPGMLRRLGPVLAGVAAVIVLSTVTDSALRAIGVFPSWDTPMTDSLFALATIYRCLYAVFGAYIAARFAPPVGRPMRSALATGVVGLVLFLAGAAATWNAGPELGPRWYPFALVATALPCSWAGGKLRELQLRTTAGM